MRIGNFGPEQNACILDTCLNNFYRFCKTKNKIRKHIYSVSDNYSSKYVACKATATYSDNQNNTMNKIKKVKQCRYRPGVAHRVPGS
jgi:hypothetical protein